MKTHNSQPFDLATTAYNWLTKLNISVNKKFCLEEIEGHPDYPALTALTDFLDYGAMDWQAVRADVRHFAELTYPLLAHIKEPGFEHLQIIDSIKAWDGIQLDTWTGIIIYSCLPAAWACEENASAVKQQRDASIFSACCYIISVILLCFFSISNRSLFFATVGLFALLGFWISLIIEAAELGLQSEAVRQVCGTVSKGGCDRILHSKIAKGLFGFSVGDAATAYFFSQFCSLLLSTFYPSASSLLPLLSISTLGIAGVSIYIQSRSRQWCALCVSVAFILLVQFFLALIYFQPPELEGLLMFSLLFVFAGLILAAIKRLLKTIRRLTPKVAELKKWKADIQLFMAQLHSEPKADISFSHSDMIIGNPQAPNTITVACNAYCPPCATAHKEINGLLTSFNSKLNLQIKWVFNENQRSDRRTVATQSILAGNRIINNSAQREEMVTDWFEWTDLKRWREKWIRLDEPDVSEELSAHSAWINANNITYTPTFFINGHRLPNRYNLKDLRFLVPSFSENC